MKKILLGLLVVGLVGSSMAQDAADKKIQAGLVTGFGLNFQRMGTKLVDKNGAGNDLIIGMNINFNLNETIGVNTGVEFDFETLKYKSSGSNIYYYYNDTEILQRQDVTSTSQLFQMSTRKQKPVYLTIPTMLLFRTKFIGYFRYFGKFGLRNSFLLSNKIYDEGFNFNPDAVNGTPIASSNPNMKAKGEMLFFKSAVGLAAGTEWNFTGSTSIAAELGYYYGFTPLHLEKNEGKTTLFTSGANNGNGNDLHFSNRATQQQLMLKVSILF